MSEIISKLIDLIMPVVKGETIVNLRMKTFQQMALWWFLLFIAQSALTVGFSTHGYIPALGWVCRFCLHFGMGH